MYGSIGMIDVPGGEKSAENEAKSESQENLIQDEIDLTYDVDNPFGIPLAGGKSMPIAGHNLIEKPVSQRFSFEENDPMLQNQRYLQNLNRNESRMSDRIRMASALSNTASSVALVVPPETAMLPHYIRSDESGISSDKQTQL